MNLNGWNKIKSFIIFGKVSKFLGKGGWFYVEVPKKYTKELKEKRKSWGMYPITASVGKSTWKTKLMIKKGGDFFVAIKSDIRKNEDIKKGDKVGVKISLI